MVTDPIRDKAQLKALADYWLKHCNFRNYALIVLGCHTALRISDILRLTWNDVYDFETDTFRSHFSIIERKTGKPKVIALHNKVMHALRLLLPHRRGDSIFSNNRKNPTPISRVQAWRIIKVAAEAVRIVGRITCHSLRKTFGYFAWKSGVSPVMLMDIYSHSSYEITKRYLGIAQEDRDKIYLSAALF